MTEDGSQFPPSLWAIEKEEDLAVTTTNACEAFHRNLEHNFISHHPSLWTFLVALNEEAKRAELNMHTEGSLPVKKARRRILQMKIELNQNFNNSLITEYDIVKNMSYLMLPVKQ